MVKSHSSGLLDDPDEEYEYMNKQTPVSLLQNNPWPKLNKKRSMSVSSQAMACSCETPLSVDGRGGQTTSSNRPDSKEPVEYEYMDIRGKEKDDENPPEQDLPPPPILPRTRREADDEGQDDYAEDENYHYTNRQPKLRQALKDKKELRFESRDSSEEYEYEEMDCFAAPPPAEAGVYQNMQGEGAEGGAEVYPSAFEPHVRVRAGVGEPVAGDRSFDNPGYWHSRMFLKPNAVPT